MAAALVCTEVGFGLLDEQGFRDAPQPLRGEVERLRSEYRELEAASRERDAEDGVALSDAQLAKLQLSALLHRYHERPPPVEEFAERYEAELHDLAAEAQRLREKNALLVFKQDDARPAAFTRTAGGQPHVRTAAEELSDEVLRLRQRHMEHRRLERQVAIEEQRLASLKDEGKRVLRQLKTRDQLLVEMRERHSKADAYLQDTSKLAALGEAELERERVHIQDLHCQVAALREASIQPARLKKESTFLVRLLDQEGGRLQTKRHLRGIDACRKLYDEVALHAPSLLPLAGRARSEMEADFAKFLRLQDAHGRSLQKLQNAVTRGLLRDTDSFSTCGARGAERQASTVACPRGRVAGRCRSACHGDRGGR